MAHPLDSCIAKLNRADVHIADLQSRVSAFLASNPYSVETKRDMNTFEHVVTGVVRCEPPSLVLAPVLSDAITNLRSALDNLVWALSVKHQSVPPPPDPIPLRDRWRNVRFPIVLIQGAWFDTKGKPGACTRNLWAVDPALHGRFKDLQPGFRRKNEAAIRRDALTVLDELWNIDKHRHLHLTQGFVGITSVRSRLRDMLPPGYGLPDWAEPEYAFSYKRGPGPFENGTVLARVHRAGTVITSFEGMDMEFGGTFDVSFEKGAPAYGGRVMRTLIRLRKEVGLILRQFQPEFT